MDRTIIKTPSGLTVVTAHHTGAVAIFGIAVRAGSADECDGQHGLAHLVEHNIFKGTGARRSWNIINRMESVGGELNAYTTKEETVIYSIFPHGEELRAIDLIADLAIDSQFPERELVKEREVVIDEINSYLDTPSEAIYDEYEQYAFAGTPWAHNILGDADSVRHLNGEDCRRFVEQYYTADNVVIFYSGAMDPDRVARTVERYFAAMPHQAALRHARTFDAPAEPFAITRSLDTHQAHVVLGSYTGGINDPDRYARALLCNIIGGPGMNSLLNVELRERAGLVYTVETSTVAFTGTGLITTYFGCDPDDVERCLRRYQRVIERLAHDGLTPARLRMARKQYLGQHRIARENRENSIMADARSVLFRGTLPDYSAFEDAILSISSDTLRTLAIPMVTPSCLIFK